MSDTIYTKGKYLNNNPTWHSEDSLWKSQKILTIINKNNLKLNTICEIGCGSGEILNQLHETMDKNLIFTGFEISPQVYEICRHKQKIRLNFYLKNINEENSLYDLVLVIDVIEHIEDYFEFLRNIKQKGKYKLFHIPLDISVQSVLRTQRLIKGRQQVGHIHYFTKETALATLEDTGYEIIDYFYTAPTIDLPVKSLKSSLARIPRKLLFKIKNDLAVRVLGGFSLMVLTK